jgi:hypothetical protein
MLWLLGKHAFWVILIFMLITILVGEFLIFRYVFSVATKVPEITVIPTRFKEPMYEAVLKEWQERQQMYSSAINQNYSNPF